jgi:uncharacterized protein DUF4153
MTETTSRNNNGGDSSGRDVATGSAPGGDAAGPVTAEGSTTAEDAVSTRPSGLPVLGPIGELERLWPTPPPAPRWAVSAAAVAGLVAASVLPGMPRPGIGLTICGLFVALPVGLLAFQRGRAVGRRWPVGRVAIGLGAVGIGLAGVAAVRASEWLAVGCAMAALCLGAAVALDVRRWAAILGTVPLFAVASLRALPWASSTVRPGKIRSLTGPWLNGLVIGGVFTFIVTALLASADQAFADLVEVLWPTVDLGMLPTRAVVFGFVTATTLGAMFAVCTRLLLPRSRSASAVGRHPAEWLTPLVLVGVTIAAFLAVEATMLFGGADVVSPGSSLSHADRAREGFGQLTVVTLIVLGLLAWAGRSAASGPARNRRLLGSVGGGLLVLALLLATSALRRLWLYQDAYGWTVTRLNAGAFELWVTVVLIGVAAGWLVRRTDLLPRFVIGSAGLGLLVVALAGPDAIVASANVARFERSQKIDTDYLSMLSEDAVPALDRLPEPKRSCALAGRTVTDDPWYGWNLGRLRANEVLRSRPPGPCSTDYGLGDGP